MFHLFCPIVDCRQFFKGKSRNEVKMSTSIPTYFADLKRTLLYVCRFKKNSFYVRTRCDNFCNLRFKTFQNCTLMNRKKLGITTLRGLVTGDLFGIKLRGTKEISTIKGNAANIKGKMDNVIQLAFFPLQRAHSLARSWSHDI